MDIIYTTLSNLEEARKIARLILDKKLANSINYFPIMNIYNWEDKIEETAEVVLIIKTKEEKFGKIEKLIENNIEHTNFIGLLSVNEVNNRFYRWLDSIVK